jgi:hypothetical protein
LRRSSGGQVEPVCRAFSGVCGLRTAPAHTHGVDGPRRAERVTLRPSGRMRGQTEARRAGLAFVLGCDAGLRLRLDRARMPRQPSAMSDARVLLCRSDSPPALRITKENRNEILRSRVRETTHRTRAGHPAADASLAVVTDSPRCPDAQPCSPDGSRGGRADWPALPLARCTATGSPRESDS